MGIFIQLVFCILALLLPRLEARSCEYLYLSPLSPDMTYLLYWHKENEMKLPYFFGYKTGCFSFQNNPKHLDPSNTSYKMDLDFWDCFEQETPILWPDFMGLINIWGHSIEKKSELYRRVNTVFKS